MKGIKELDNLYYEASKNDRDRSSTHRPSLVGLAAVRNAILDDLIEEAGKMLTVTDERQQIQLADWLRSHKENTQ